MGLYDSFKTDPEVERKGILLDYGSFRIRIARAGGANKRFLKVLDHKTRPYKQALKAEQLDEDIADSVMAEVYADAVILGWETKVDGQFKSGIESETGELLPFTAQNVTKTLLALPELFADIRQQSSQFQNFRALQREDDAKNS